MFSNNRDSRNNISGVLDRSIKSIKTNSTYFTPKRNNLKQLISSYSLNKKNTVNKEKLLTDLNSRNVSNNISKISNNYNDLINYLHTEPSKESKELINNADKLLKERKNNHLMLNQLVKSVYMKKVDEIRLNNYKIKKLKNKRNELNKKYLEINNAYESTEKRLENDYKNFLLFVEDNNKSSQKTELILNNYKNIFSDKEVEFNKLNELNKKLKSNIEFLVKKIYTLKNYGSFIHKIFGKDFIYKNVQKTDDKNYIDLSEELIDIYEKKEKNDFDEKLLDEHWLITQFKENEQNLINIIKEKESFRKDFIKIEIYDKMDMDKLIKKKNDLKKRLEDLKEERDKLIKSMGSYNSPEIMDTILDCIADLTETLELNNPSTSILLKDKNESNYTIISSDLLKIIKGKENIINDYIKEIEKIVEGDNIDDKELIEAIILERKKEVKKEKLQKLINKQKEEIEKKNQRAFERAHRIVVKGRKIIDYPFIKPKKKKKIVVKINEDNYEYLYYSSDEDNK